MRLVYNCSMTKHQPKDRTHLGLFGLKQCFLNTRKKNIIYVLVLLFVYVLTMATGTTPKPQLHYRFKTYPVDACPRNETEFSIAAARRNCPGQSRYLCAPDRNLSSLIEFCTDRPPGLYGPDNCVRLDGTGDLNHYNCVDRFVSSCPIKSYGDEEIYQFPACLNINKVFQCFVADRSCQERIRLNTTTEIYRDVSNTENRIRLNTTTEIYPAGSNTDNDFEHIWIPILIICLLVLLVILLVFGYRRIKKKRDESEVNTERLCQFLSQGEITIYHARGIVVGCAGAGKTTLLKRLQDLPLAEVRNTKKTELVDVHVNGFEVYKDTIRGVKENKKLPIIVFSKDEMIDDRQHIYAVNEQHDPDNYMEESQQQNNDIDMRETRYQNNAMDKHEEQDNAIGMEERKQVGCEIHHEDVQQVDNDIDTSEEAMATERTQLLDDTDIEEYALTKIKDAVKELSKEKSRKKITFLDFGGESMYYAFHQIYLSAGTFFILVVDIEKNFKDHCETEEGSGSRFSSWTYEEFYKFWLKSIDSFSDITTQVIVVATHAENKSKTEFVKFKNDFISLFDNRKDLQRHLNSERFFSIGLPKEGMLEELSDIKKNICDLVTSLSCWKRRVQRASAIFEQILHSNKKQKVISRTELMNYNERLDPKFRMDEDGITSLLSFLHQVGTVLHFEEEGVRDTIILDVQWFVEAFKCVLAYRVGIETNDMERRNFYQTGKLNDRELQKIWGKSHIQENEYLKHKNVIIQYMENLGLLAVCELESRLWYYFPCMNKRKFEDEYNKLKKKFKPSSILCFKFDKKKQLPIFLFYSLVIKCMKIPNWKILLEENKQHSCFYDDAACFSYQKHIVLLCICNFQIQAQICHPLDIIEPSVLREIRISLGNTIGEFEKYSFQIGYKCDKGEFYKEQDIGFIPEKVFPVQVDDHFCDNCGPGTHFLDNKICWVLAEDQPGLSGISNTDITRKIEEKNDEGARSIKHILDACIDGNRQDCLFHLKNEIGERKRLLERPHESGWNVLHYAAKGGDLKIFCMLISKDIDVCRKTNDQMNILHIASKYGHVEICEYILKMEEFATSLYDVSSQGKNACHFAAEGGSVPILELLIKNGIDAQATTEDRKNIFHIACIYNKLEMCECIAKMHPKLVNAEDEDKWNAAMFAAKNGHTSILDFLNKNGVSCTQASASARNALHIACDNGHFSACKYLVENCPSLLNQVDHKGRHAGHFAVRGGNMETLTYLETKMDVKPVTKSGMNILHMACLHCQYKMCEYILRKYPSLNEGVTDSGWTTAHFVSGKGNTKGNEQEIFQMLLRANRKADIMLLTKHGNSVLTLAIEYNNYDFAEYLFQNHHKLLHIQRVNSPWETGNDDPKMKALLEKHLG